MKFFTTYVVFNSKNIYKKNQKENVKIAFYVS